MNLNGSNRNGNATSPAGVEEPQSKLFPEASARPIGPAGEERGEVHSPEPGAFVTRAGVQTGEGFSKSKLVLLGGGLGVAVLFFVFTALMSKSSKKSISGKVTTQQTKQETANPPKGSVTPVMDSVHQPAPDNVAGQLAPNDILRTRSQDPSKNNPPLNPSPEKPDKVGSLGGIPSFAATQQRWEEPQPYGAAGESNSDGVANNPNQETQDHNALKEPSLVFVRSLAESPSSVGSKQGTDGADGPLLDIAPGTRIAAKLETQISSAVQAPVVAVVEYTYAVGDRIVVPAGAHVYGQMQQADRSGLVGVKFDEIELLDGKREKIEAIGAGLDLGPIKGDVFGKNTGKNFLVRAASGLGSVLAEIAGNNSSGAFSEDDMLRERVAENIGTAGDSEVMHLNANSRIVVSVPADTKIYVIFTKHEESSLGLHKVASAAP
jgi:hypothetical protein